MKENDAKRDVFNEYLGTVYSNKVMRLALFQQSVKNNELIIFNAVLKAINKDK